jgi:hypothetical protein
MNIEMWPIDRPIPYARNPRRNAAAVGKVAASITEYGWRQPIVVDEEGVVVVGHTRLLAAQKLGMAEVPVHVAAGLTAAQIKAYRLADNRVHEEAEWDNDMLKLEIEELGKLSFDLGLTGFNADELDALLKGDDSAAGGNQAAGLAENYSRKIEAPIYTPKGDRPPETDLFDRTRTDKLLAEIEGAALPTEVAVFLRNAAERHTAFRFDRIAEYYAHASAEVQDLMENSALVIIDFDKAVELGYVKLTESMLEQAGYSKSRVAKDA